MLMVPVTFFSSNTIYPPHQVHGQLQLLLIIMIVIRATGGYNKMSAYQKISDTHLYQRARGIPSAKMGAKYSTLADMKS